MQPLDFIFNGEPVSLTYKLNAFSTGDIYHVIVKSPDFSLKFGRDHFFQTYRDGDGIVRLEFTIYTPDVPKNQFRVSLSQVLLKLNAVGKPVRRTG